MEVFYYHRPSGMAYAERLNALRVALPADIRLISMLVPTSIAFYGPDKIRSGINSEYDAIHSIYEREDAGIIKVDAFSQLSQHAQDNLYFRTDHHWNGQGAYYGYVAFCQALGLEAQPLSEMTLTQPDHHFLGSLYGYTDNSPLLIGSEDRAEIYLPRETGEIKWYSDASMVDPQPGVLLNADFPQDNQYLLFSGGDVPLTVIESSQKNGRKICVVKDSYGNALVPYLMNDYQEIYIIDPRQFSDPLIPFLKEKGINDLMILNYSFAISNPSWLNGFDLISGYTEE